METRVIDVAMKHSHTMFVMLLVIAMLVSVIMAFKNRGSKDKPTPKLLKISHMILGTFTLITGIYLMINAPDGRQPYIWVKLVAVIVAMVLGIVGGRKNSVPMTSIAMLLLGATLALAYSKPAFLTLTPDGLASDDEIEAALSETENPPKPGKEIGESLEVRNMRLGKSLYYKYSCNTCHGDDGAFGFQGAKNLSESTVTDEEIGNMIRNGKGVMPAVEGVKDAEVEMLIAYSKSFRK